MLQVYNNKRQELTVHFDDVAVAVAFAREVDGRILAELAHCERCAVLC